jgi:hypothetical protein
MTNQDMVLERVNRSLREVSRLRDFIAAVEVGSKIAGDMLDGLEKQPLDCLDEIGEKSWNE